VHNALQGDVSSYEVTRKQQNTIIDSATLRAADGRFITYDDIGIMLQLRGYLYTMLYGTKDAQNTVTGPYQFNGKAYCLRTLTALEKELDSSVRDSWLTEVRNTFKERTKDTKKRAEGTKTQQYLYIKESCSLHNRLNSVLLIWAKAPEGQEDDAVDIHIHSFYEMAQFATDLMNFLDDMISSCPGAKKQFLDKIPDLREREKIKRLLDHIFEQQKKKISKVKNS